MIHCSVHRASKMIETTDLRDCLDPINCVECGARLGWYHTGISDGVEAYCDCCAPLSVEAEERGDDE